MFCGLTKGTYHLGTAGQGKLPPPDPPRKQAPQKAGRRTSRSQLQRRPCPHFQSTGPVDGCHHAARLGKILQSEDGLSACALRLRDLGAGCGQGRAWSSSSWGTALQESRTPGDELQLRIQSEQDGGRRGRRGKQRRGIDPIRQCARPPQAS